MAIGLGWEASLVGQSYDLDASVFMLGAAGKIIHEKDFVLQEKIPTLSQCLCTIA